MSNRPIVGGRSKFSEELSCEARELSELLIVQQIIEDSNRIPERPGRTTDVGESFGDNQGPKSIFICGRCDMIVHADDRACEFCGAEFEDAESQPGIGNDAVHKMDRRSSDENERMQINGPYRQAVIPLMPSAEKVDVLSMFDSSRSRLGDEHISGGASNNFLSYAKMLRAIEGMISEAGEFGVETVESRKALLAAWKACQEGRWDRAMQLADESKRLLSPGVTNLVESQLYCLRSALLEMKRKGRSVTSLIIEMKTIQRDLKEMRLDEAMRSTKAIIAEIKKIQMQILNDISTGAASDEEPTNYNGQYI